MIKQKKALKEEERNKKYMKQWKQKVTLQKQIELLSIITLNMHKLSKPSKKQKTSIG